MGRGGTEQDFVPRGLGQLSHRVYFSKRSIGFFNFFNFFFFSFFFSFSAKAFLNVIGTFDFTALLGFGFRDYPLVSVWQLVMEKSASHLLVGIAVYSWL